MLYNNSPPIFPSWVQAKRRLIIKIMLSKISSNLEKFKYKISIVSFSTYAEGKQNVSDTNPALRAHFSLLCPHLEKYKISSPQSNTEKHPYNPCTLWSLYLNCKVQNCCFLSNFNTGSIISLQKCRK
jgi:hypothetical protein